MRVGGQALGYASVMLALGHLWPPKATHFYAFAHF